MDYIPIVNGTNTLETCLEWYRRETPDPGTKSSLPWDTIPASEVPTEVVERELKRAARKVRIRKFGYDPEAPPGPFAVITKGPG